jgi:hypothetical protein
MHCRPLMCISFSLTLVLAACNSHQGPPVQTDKDTLNGSQTSDDTTHLKYNHLISNIPVPFEILNKLSNSSMSYKAELLNPLWSANTYNRRESKSLNLGVYGADLTYIISLSEFREFAPHLKIVKKLADELHIPLAFDDDMLSHYNTNPPNKDTLQNAMFKSYNEIDRSLKANDRIGMAALVVAGGWIESLYLTTQTIGDNENSGKYAELYKLVFLQKKHLGNLIGLLNDFKTEPYQKIKIQLQQIEGTYGTATEARQMKQEDVKSIATGLASLRALIIRES